ncbi:MAG: hypothetical protein WCO89_14305, partial [Syntrophus sp. (in: bacteria)]
GTRTPNPTPPIPWRTLSLEPAKGDQLPDWLLMDVFSIAYDKTFLSHTQGKININSSIEPFGLSRTAPLRALLIPSSANTSTSATDIAQQLSIYDGTGGITGCTLPTDMYVYSGQICQIADMAGSGQTQFEREALARDVVGLVTTKSSDFKVYAVAQALGPNRMAPTTPGKVMAEQRVEALISRVVDVGPDNIPGTADDMAGPDHVVGTADDIVFKSSTGSNIAKLKYDGTDPALEGLAGRPPVRFQVSQFQFSNQ